MKTDFSAATISDLTVKRINRRSFMGRAAAASGAALATQAFTYGATSATTATASDIDILKFLAAAELLEADLWQQYCELATNNPSFNENLSRIDPALPDYVCGDFYDELSHAEFINAYLEMIGQEPVDLDAFRTLPSVEARGAGEIGRLTSLTNLNVDTSYYNRYRGDFNPDAPFSEAPPQVATLTHVSAVPTGDRVTARQALATAQVAAFHFGSVEQGGSSLYNNLLSNVTSQDAVNILASIGPTEVYHLGLFFSSLSGIFGFKGQNGPSASNVVTFPNIRRDVTRFQVTPHPADFLTEADPVTSVIRPRSKAKAGAVAAVTSLASSNLFAGQSQAFVDAATGLATAADNAGRNGAQPV